MTHDLTIGKFIETKEGDETYLGAERMERADAPAFPGSEVSAHQNRIMIPMFGPTGYRAFDKALRTHSPALAAKLLSQDDLIVPITKPLVQQVKKLVKDYRRANPGAKPSFETNQVDDCTLARLEVLKWWTLYAFEHFGDEAVIRIS